VFGVTGVVSGSALFAGAPGLGRGVRWWGLGPGEGREVGVGSGDLAGPGPGRVDVEEWASCGAHETSGDGEDA
jgi:hypothetical protein